MKRSNVSIALNSCYRLFDWWWTGLKLALPKRVQAKLQEIDISVSSTIADQFPANDIGRSSLVHLKSPHNKNLIVESKLKIFDSNHIHEMACLEAERHAPLKIEHFYWGYQILPHNLLKLIYCHKKLVDDHIQQLPSDTLIGDLYLETGDGYIKSVNKPRIDYPSKLLMKKLGSSFLVKAFTVALIMFVSTNFFVKNKISETKLQNEAYKTQIEQVLRIQNNAQSLLNEIHIQKQYEEVAQLGIILNHLSTSIPRTTSLVRFNLTGSIIQIEARGLDPAKVVSQLNNNKNIKNVSLVRSSKQSQSNLSDFSISLEYYAGEENDD